MIWLWLACVHSAATWPPPGWESTALPAPSQDTIARWRASAVSRADGWRHAGVQQTSHGWEEAWCGPDVSESACWSGTVTRGDHRGDSWLIVGADTSGGVSWRGGAHPVSGPWGMGIAVDDDTYALHLVRRHGVTLTRELHLGSALSWQVEQTAFSVPTAAPLADLFGGPQPFADALVRQLIALRMVVDRDFDTVRRCAYRRYSGDGQPICDPTPLPPPELAALKTSQLAAIDEISALLQQDSRDLYALFLHVAPPPP